MLLLGRWWRSEGGFGFENIVGEEILKARSDLVVGYVKEDIYEASNENHG